MAQYRIIYGHVKDFGPQGPVYRQGWWWHCYSPSPVDPLGYSPEGPFVSQTHARRHLKNTQRGAKIAELCGCWPAMPANTGWCKNWGNCRRPTTKPLRGTLHFGKKYRLYQAENVSKKSWKTLQDYL